MMSLDLWRDWSWRSSHIGGRPGVLSSPDKDSELKGSEWNSLVDCAQCICHILMPGNECCPWLNGEDSWKHLNLEDLVPCISSLGWFSSGGVYVWFYFITPVVIQAFNFIWNYYSFQSGIHAHYNGIMLGSGQFDMGALVKAVVLMVEWGIPFPPHTCLVILKV